MSPGYRAARVCRLFESCCIRTSIACRRQAYRIRAVDSVTPLMRKCEQTRCTKMRYIQPRILSRTKATSSIQGTQAKSGMGADSQSSSDPRTDAGAYEADE